MSNVLITGANGFIGKNLKFALIEQGHVVDTYSHNQPLSSLREMVSAADFIFHLAGVNRPDDDQQFFSGNLTFTQTLVEAVEELNPSITVVYTSSKQAIFSNSYGISKKLAEDNLLNSTINTIIFRLPGVFGKWCKPNYNSVVATFCYNIANDIDIKISSPEANLELVYIDDVISEFSKLINEKITNSRFSEISIKYNITLSELAETIRGFRSSRSTLIVDSVGCGITRALYSTYLSYLNADDFSYSLPVYSDARGIFAELIKTPEHGQFSFFTAKPGVVRGGHYHHSKNEKFIVVSGVAIFKFIHIESGDVHELITSSDKVQVVETIPGWAHNITNIGDDDLIVMLWANEIFERDNPDTVSWNM